MGNTLGNLVRGIVTAAQNRYLCKETLRTFEATVKAQKFCRNRLGQSEAKTLTLGPNRLREYFENNRSGPGIYKFDHYFDIYDRHFRRFVGRAPHIIEIGVFSGGSLGMWRDYFGTGTHITGIDIQPECKEYEREGIDVLIGDQSDREFLRKVRARAYDIVIDDGSHIPEHQIVSLEELLPGLRPGGVYLCEDISGEFNNFAAFLGTLASRLHASPGMEALPDGGKYEVSPLQQLVQSIAIYPFCAVIETHDEPPAELRSLRRGTAWQPQAFLDPKR